MKVYGNEIGKKRYIERNVGKFNRKASVAWRNRGGENLHIVVSEKDLEECVRGIFWDSVKGHHIYPEGINIRLMSFVGISKHHINCLIQCEKHDKFMFSVWAKWLEESIS